MKILCFNIHSKFVIPSFPLFLTLEIKQNKLELSSEYCHAYVVLKKFILKAV